MLNKNIQEILDRNSTKNKHFQQLLKISIMWKVDDQITIFGTVMPKRQYSENYFQDYTTTSKRGTDPNKRPV